MMNRYEMLLMADRFKRSIKHYMNEIDRPNGVMANYFIRMAEKELSSIDDIVNESFNYAWDLKPWFSEPYPYKLIETYEYYVWYSKLSDDGKEEYKSVLNNCTEKDEDLVGYWDRRYQDEVREFFDMHQTRNALLASDLTWSIRRLKSAREEVTCDSVYNKLVEYYPDRWEILANHQKIKDMYFPKVVGYYKDWEELHEDTKEIIRKSKRDSFVRYLRRTNT